MADILKIPFANQGAPDLAVSDGESVGFFGEANSGKSDLLESVAKLKKGVKFRELPRISSSDRALFNSEIAYFYGQEISKGKALCEDVISELSAKILVGSYEVMDALEIPRCELKRKVKDASSLTKVKLAFLATLARGAKLIIIDDVFGIRPAFKKRLSALLTKVSKECGISYLIASTDLAFLTALCKRIAVVDGGHLIEVNTAKSIITAPLHPYTKWLVSAHNMKKEIGTTFIRTEKDSKAKRGCRFAHICPYTTEICSQRAPEFKPNGTGTVGCHKVK